MSNLLDKFRCPECGVSGLIEVFQIDCVLISDIVINGEQDIGYVLDEICEAEVDRYQCSKCGYVINHITSDQELLEYLKGL